MPRSIKNVKVSTDPKVKSFNELGFWKFSFVALAVLWVGTWALELTDSPPDWGTVLSKLEDPLGLSQPEVAGELKAVEQSTAVERIFARVALRRLMGEAPNPVPVPVSRWEQVKTSTSDVANNVWGWGKDAAGWVENLFS